MIDELKKKIASSEGVDFAPFGKGISDEWIIKAEKRLNFTFPETYKWWLKNYMGGRDLWRRNIQYLWIRF